MNKKRKVVSQQISKFFKPENDVKKKKIAVIGVNDLNTYEVNALPKNASLKNTVAKCTVKLQSFCADTEKKSYINLDESCFKNNQISTISDSQISATYEQHSNSLKPPLVQHYTPLELQFMKVKSEHEDLLLFVECGYKYKFFGKDAEIAAEELNIYKNMDHNFMTASIPVHRLHIHMSRLLENGHKVGVVAQTETSALKAASSNKNTPFVRKLMHVYTKATYLNLEERNIGTKKSTGDYICSISQDEGCLKVLLVNPSTCDIVYDMSLDISGLNLIFHVFKPCEIVTGISDLNMEAENLIKSYKVQKVVLRIEKLCYKMSDSFNPLFERLKIDISLKQCAYLMYSYLAQFHLENLLDSSSVFRPFNSNTSSMKLDYTCIQNLELFNNNGNNQVDGSLFSILDHTNSAYGKRLLMSWLREPLRDACEINKRLDAVNELKLCLQLKCVLGICKTLQTSVDLENGLSLIYNQRCAPTQFLNLCESLENIRSFFVHHREEFISSFHSKTILDVCNKVPELLGNNISDFLKKLNKDQIKNGTKAAMFVNTIDFPRLHKCLQEIQIVEDLLAKHLSSDVTRVLGRKLEFKTVSGIEYLIEVGNAEIKNLPENWIKVSATKKFTRIRTPFIESHFHKLLCLRETLLHAADEAWQNLLIQFKDKYNVYRKVVFLLSTFDCLFSLAIVANGVGYVRPTFTDNVIMIKDGRHPIIETLSNNQYVSNDTCLNETEKVMLIFGPNMGGKSSYVKQVAICCIMAQIGCYVPATSASLPILDGIFCRMGASDKIAGGKSTFMVELEEASYIMKNATCNSLVILDELGRGTSTHDGTAIAYATLKHFIEKVQCFLLFITHYPTLSELKCKYTGSLSLYYMTFMNNEVDLNAIVFLYKLTKGQANKSYGLNVARLAGIDELIINKAALVARELETNTSIKRLLKRVFNQDVCSDRLLALKSIKLL